MRMERLGPSPFGHDGSGSGSGSGRRHFYVRRRPFRVCRGGGANANGNNGSGANRRRMMLAMANNNSGDGNNGGLGGVEVTVTPNNSPVRMNTSPKKATPLRRLNNNRRAWKVGQGGLRLLTRGDVTTPTATPTPPTNEDEDEEEGMDVSPPPNENETADTQDENWEEACAAVANRNVSMTELSWMFNSSIRFQPLQPQQTFSDDWDGFPSN